MGLIQQRCSLRSGAKGGLLQDVTEASVAIREHLVVAIDEAVGVGPAGEPVAGQPGAMRGPVSG